MNQTFDNRILEGNFVIAGVVQLKDGFIKENPFSKSVGNCLAARWMLENRELAVMKIREVMREQRLGEHEVDECYDYAVYYFLEKEDRDFNPDYFGDEASGTYSIDIYCLYKIKMIVYEYRNEMKKRLDSTVHLIDIDKDETDKVHKKCISYDMLSKATFEDEKENYGFNDVIEFEDLQEILDIEIPLYNEEFKILGMTDFNFRSYVYHMFLSDKEVTLDGSQLTEDSLNKISESMGITPSALKKINKIVKDSIRTRKDMFKDLPDLMSRLIQGKLKGWKPKYYDI